MITPEKIDEWLREVEERPSSASLIIQLIANRLSALSRRYEEVLAENTLLLTGKKVEEYEARIASLEYQLDLLKRQLGGETAAAAAGEASPATASLFIYTSQGLVLRRELDPSELASSRDLGQLRGQPAGAEEGPPPVPQLLAVGSHEELLFLFDSGRTATIAAADIPAAAGDLDWEQASLEEPRGGEELAAIVPIGRMPLSDCCVQASRQGAIKKMVRSAFESYVAKHFVGTGVKLSTDRTCGLALCEKDDRVVLASQEGYLLTVETARLAYAIEDSIRLSPTDHIVTAFALGQKKQIALLTNTGKCIVRDTGWLEPAGTSLRTRGQAAFSDERRKGGIRLVGAAAVDEKDWGAALDSDGRLGVYPMRDLLGAGTVFSEPREDLRLVAFAVFSSLAG
jgi:DNA gyrase/topoisomerase IV subunit A